MTFISNGTYWEDRGEIEVRLQDSTLIYGFIGVLKNALNSALVAEEYEKAQEYLSMLIDMQKCFADIGERRNAEKEADEE